MAPKKKTIINFKLGEHSCNNKKKKVASSPAISSPNFQILVAL